MSEVTKEKQTEEECAARKIKAAGRATEGRKRGRPVKADSAGRGGKTVAELAEAGAAIVGKKRSVKKASKRRSIRDGAEMLKQASDQALVEITKDVVSKLKAGAKEGNVVCVKTLMSFSEKKKPRKKVRRGMSPNMRYIESLANGPQWDDGKPWGPGVLGPGAPFGPMVPV